MVELKKIDIWSFAKIIAFIMLITGLLLGVLNAITFWISGIGTTEVILVSLIASPLLYTVLGVAMGIISAFAYNWLAKRIGGVKLEFNK